MTPQEFRDLASDTATDFVLGITSPQVVQAFLVIVFSLVSSVLVLKGTPVPETLSNILFAIVGYYFAVQSQPSNSVVKSASAMLSRLPELGSSERASAGVQSAGAEKSALADGGENVKDS